MRDESELIQLQRQVAMARALVRQTALKIEDLEASLDEIYSFKERVIMFPRDGKGKHPTRVDTSEDVGEFILT